MIVPGINIRIKLSMWCSKMATITEIVFYYRNVTSRAVVTSRVIVTYLVLLVGLVSLAVHPLQPGDVNYDNNFAEEQCKP